MRSNRALFLSGTNFPVSLLSLLLGVGLLLLAPTAIAQVPDPVVSAEAPKPSSEHSYLGNGIDTVDPATGLLTFELPLQTPAGRVLNFPFGFHYSSAEEYVLTGQNSGAALTWIPRDPMPFQVNGWSYKVPILTGTERIWSLSVSSPPNGPTETYQCDASLDYVFQGLTSTQYTLDIAGIWTDPTSSPGTDCGNQLTIGIPSQGISGERHGVLATIPQNPWNNLPTSNPPITVIDQSGTNYVFYAGANPGVSSGQTEGLNFGNIASSITDRNGNQVVIASNAKGYVDTLGRTVVSWTGLGNNGDRVTVSGLTNPFTLSWTNVPVTFPEAVTYISGSSHCTTGATPSSSINVVSQIELPNSEAYTFSYDPTYGMVTRINFPGGGYVRYVWGLNTASTEGYFTFVSASGDSYCTVHYDMPAVTDRYVSFNGTTEVLHQHFVYSTVWNGSGSTWTSKSTTVTSTITVGPSTQETVTTYTYAPKFPDTGGQYDTSTGSSPVPVETSVVYQDGSNHTLKTVEQTWANVYISTGAQTILNNGQGSATLRCYDGNDQLTALYEYGFQAEGAKPADPSCVSSAGLNTSAIGPLRRQTGVAYQNFLGGTPSTNIVNEPSSVTVYDGSGNQDKQTTYSYSNTVQTSGTTKGLVNPPGVRGNVSSITRWLNSGGTSPVTSYTYFDTGHIQTSIDACGNTSCADMVGSNHITTYGYTDSYSSCGGAAPAGVTNAYLTLVTNPLLQTNKYCYGYSDGHLRGSTDPNGQTTSYAYVDTLDRLTQVTYPTGGGDTTYAYNDTPPTPSVTTTVEISSGSLYTSVSVMDGMGHHTQTQLISDPAGTDYTTTTYDGQGRKYTVTNPYRTGGAQNLTTYAYDALDRPTVVTHPDGTFITTTFTGRATEVADEGNGTQNVQRISQTDGLGHLVSVCEVSGTTQPGAGGTPSACGQDISATGFLTTYTYDALDNLLSVSQGGYRPRTFTYDSLSRLMCSANPEIVSNLATSTPSCPSPYPGTYTAETIGYSYDANSNVSSKISPKPNQQVESTAATVTTTLGYDALNRTTSKSYSDGVTPTANFVYDVCPSGGCPSGVNPQYAVGRKIESSAGLAKTFDSYDPMGRVVEEWQCTPVNCASTFIPLTYTYDLASDLISATNGFAVTLTYGYNAALQPTGITSSFSDSNHPGTLLSGVTYTPAGLLSGATLGNGAPEALVYDTRNRLSSIVVGSAFDKLYDMKIGYAPNSDVISANDCPGGTIVAGCINGSWTYGYDALNRLSSSSQTNSTASYGIVSYTYAFDRFGNRLQQNVTAGSGWQSTLGFTGNYNHIDTYSYDAAGNLLNDGTTSYVYDAENRITSATNGLSGTSDYVYDATGRRVEKAVGGVATDYLYDLKDKQIATFNSSELWIRGEVYAGGRHLATYANGTTYFDHADWLGTERVRTNVSGAVCETIASLPFGDGQTIAGSCSSDPSPLHFTGKERDSESNLDNFGARYDSSSLGRFLTPDWSASPDPVPFVEISDPQSLNLYAYVRNNPLSRVDKDGHCIEDLCVVETVVVVAVVTAGLAVHGFMKWFNSEKSKMESPANKNAVDDIVHPNEHLDKDLNKQTQEIQGSTLDPTGQAKDTLNGVSAGAAIVGAASVPETGPLTGEKVLGAVVDGNAKAIGQTADAAAKPQQNRQAPQTQKQQQQPPTPAPKAPQPCAKDNQPCPASGGTT
jgi:RHS repeat-associated protein